MRKYKFRGKCVERNRWVYGCYVKGVQEDKAYILNKHDGYWPWGDIWSVVYPETVGQFTGLHDKNGKEIYEGDILKDNKGKVYEIVWGHDLLWLAKTNEKQGNCYCPKGLVEHGAVVAGNRWDNPELMKEGSV